VHFSAQTNSTKEALIFNIYKNGKLVGKKLTALDWKDSEAANLNIRNCFTVESEFVRTGNRSLHSEPVCVDGNNSEFIAVTDKRVKTNLTVTNDKTHFAQPVLQEWGAADDRLQFNRIKINSSGLYAIHVVYNNRQHTIDSGVTNAVKALKLINIKDESAQNGIVQMPNVKDDGAKYPLVTSTAFTVNLEAGDYILQFSDFFNMSYLASNKTYKGNGGITGPVNKASIAGIKITRIQ
jgi:hypothetical protein